MFFNRVPILEREEKEAVCKIETFSGATRQQKLLIMKVISGLTCKLQSDIDSSKIEPLFKEIKKSILDKSKNPYWISKNWFFKL